MIVSVIVLIFSFLFQGFISNYINYTLTSPSWFSTIYILITLVILFPYFDNSKNYLKLLIIFGLLMDIVYTNTFILNVVVFLIIYFLCKLINFFLPHNIVTINLLNIISVVIYHILIFVILMIIGYDKYPLGLLFIIIKRSVPMTIIYGTVMYFIISKTLNYLNIKTLK